MMLPNYVNVTKLCKSQIFINTYVINDNKIKVHVEVKKYIITSL